MNQDIYNKLEIIAQKLNVAVEQLWEIFIRQSVLHGTTGIISNSVVIILFACSSYYFVKNKKPWFEKISYSTFATGTGICGIFSIGFTLIWALVFCLCFPTYYSKIVNPGYFAWREIQELLK